jgi:hypothetical protein
MANAKPTYGILAATKVTIDGVTKTMGEWAAERGLELRLVYERTRFGDTHARALRPKRPSGKTKEERNAERAKKCAEGKESPPASAAKQRALTSGFAEEFVSTHTRRTKYGSMPHRFE